MKKGVKNEVLKVIAKVAEVESNILYSGWPPPCLGFIYQPKRPEKLKMYQRNGNNPSKSIK